MPEAFVLDQYGNPITFKMTTQAGRKAVRVYLPPDQADDLLAAWEPAEEVETTPLWQLGVGLAVAAAAIWMTARIAL